jgi:hypothetical protein
MKRETIAMYANTPFQQFLALLKSTEEMNEDLWLEEPLLHLKAAIELELEEKSGVEWSEQEMEKMETMAVKGYLVGSSKNL